MVMMTFGAVFNTITNPGLEIKLGLFDDNNGIFFTFGAAEPEFVIRSQTGPGDVEVIQQSSWNTDKLDGTGPTGVTLDLSKIQIFWLDFEWLGSGTVRCGFVLEGKPVTCHAFHHANVATSVYMTTPNLPMRYEIQAGANNGPAASVECICGMVSSEGGFTDVGRNLVATRGVTPMTTLNSTATFPLIALRLKSTDVDGHMTFHKYSVVCPTTSLYEVMMIRNPTFAGTAPVWAAHSSSSVAEESVGFTNATTITAGEIISSVWAQSATMGEVNELIPTMSALGSFINGTSEVICLAVRKISNQAEDFYASLEWREE
jgi:hypothetical protein